jgi:hypothetical protein
MGGMRSENEVGMGEMTSENGVGMGGMRSENGVGMGGTRSENEVDMGGMRNANTGTSKKTAGIIKTYHSKIVKHIKMIQVSKCGERT